MESWRRIAWTTVAAVGLLARPGGAHAQDPAESGEEAGSDAAPVVGTIEMTANDRTRMFDVREGPVTEGFATGYSQQPRGEAMVLGASLMGWDRESDATITVSVGVWKETGEHMCDPFANQVRFAPPGERAGTRRLRPGATPSETCPPPEEGTGGLTIRLNLSEAVLDEEAGTLRVAGTFAGPLGRGDDAMQVTEGRFEATLRSFDALR